MLANCVWCFRTLRQGRCRIEVDSEGDYVISSTNRQPEIGFCAAIGKPASRSIGAVALLVAMVSGFPAGADENRQRPLQSVAEEALPVVLAQFQIPSQTPGGKAPALPKRLTYQYNYGTESEINYRMDPDLNKGVKDDVFVVTPDLEGFITYRPTDWLEGTVEIEVLRDISISRQKLTTLPNGDLERAPADRFELLIDQAHVTLKGVTDPFEFTVGRRNFEDDLHTLYDTSIDVAMVTFKPGRALRVEASVGRENFIDWDLLNSNPKDRNDTYMLYSEYRGIENIKLAGYAVYRDDNLHQEGQPFLLGARSIGYPTERTNYWIDLAHVRGEDEEGRKLRGYAVNLGGTYRFADLPFNPSFTLGYAFGSGDDPGDSSTNNEFRQTGLGSNEMRFSGVSELKIYGEVLDPELSNLHIFTAGLGFRPAEDVYLDLVYHHYELDQFADELRNSAITAQLNPNAINPSKNVGDALDVVLGFRNVFGVRGLGVDVRVGWLFPGRAFRRNVGNEDEPAFRDADLGFSLVAKALF